jgi:hypothetical protein
MAVSNVFEAQQSASRTLLFTGSKLWVEIEDDKGAKSVGSFDLRM